MTYSKEKNDDQEDENQIKQKRSCEIYSKQLIQDKSLLNALEEVRNEQSKIQQDQLKMLEKNESILKTLEFISATIEVKGKSKKEISSLENVLVEQKNKLENYFEMEKIRKHVKKKHNFIGETQKDLVSFFFFLVSKSIIYKGWDHFHCIKCLKYARENSPIIQEMKRQHDELASQINEIKYCCF